MMPPEVFTLLGPDDGSTIVGTPDAIAQGTILHVNWSSSLGCGCVMGGSLMDLHYAGDLLLLRQSVLIDTVIS